MSDQDLRTVAILATLDTKHQEASFLADEIRDQGLVPIIIDVGVIGEVDIDARYSRETVAQMGGSSLASLLENPTRETAGPVMAKGATEILDGLLSAQTVNAVIGIGGTQGTSLCCHVMQALPYGFPKIMVSTAASGDTSAFVGIKDITMMFSVCDLLGLNPLTRSVLSNAAGAACGMAERYEPKVFHKSKPVVAMTNLGVLTHGAVRAQGLLEAAGFEVIVFHAVGSGGRAMEQMMKDGLITAVFDYALGEISDEVFGALRSSGPERLTVASALSLPQVVVPGGAEHLGIFVTKPNEVPKDFEQHKYVFHSPVIFVPRLNENESIRVAQVIGKRLAQCTSPLCVLLPEGGTSRYSIPGEPLHDPLADKAMFVTLEETLPKGCEVIRLPHHAEQAEFIEFAVDKLIAMVKAQK